jgi:hypothetical protein
MGLEDLRNYQQIGEHVYQYLLSGDASHLKCFNKSGPHIWGVAHVLRTLLGSPRNLRVIDERIIEVLLTLGQSDDVAAWIGEQVKKEKEGDDFHAVYRDLLSRRKVPEGRIIAATLQHVSTYTRADGQPNSTCRYLISLPDLTLRHTAAIMRGDYHVIDLLTPIIRLAPERIPLILDEVFHPKNHWASILRALLERPDKAYERRVVDFFRAMTDVQYKFGVACEMAAYDHARYLPDALAVCRAILTGSTPGGDVELASCWLVETLGVEAIPDMVRYVTTTQDERMGCHILKHTLETLGLQAIAVARAAAASQKPAIRAEGIASLLPFNAGGAEDAILEAGLQQGLKLPDAQLLVTFIGLAMRWNPDRLQELLWPLLEHRSKPVRSHAVRALLMTGAAAIPRAARLLEHRKADCRLAAVQLLLGLGTSEAMGLVAKRLGDESDEDVRDAILLAMEATAGKEPRALDVKEITARIERVRGKLGNPVADWIHVAGLPQLCEVGGGPLDPDLAAYLLFRQSRVKEMSADVEAAGVYRRLERMSAASFALAVLQGFLASRQDAEDRWALALAGILGDDRVVSLLAAQIRTWADSSRGKLAEYAVQALALLGSDAALCLVDTLAIRYRIKLKNIGKAAVEAFALAAAARGMTPDELGDRVVPWLGFAPGQERIVTGGAARFRVMIGTDFKVQFYDLTKNKKVAKLPPTVPADIQTEMKELIVNLKEVVKGQLLRMENLMVRQHRWPASRWCELYQQHPLLVPFAVRLIWGTYDHGGRLTTTFRAMEDHSLADVDDEAIALPTDACVGIVHPLELAPETRQAWLTQQADYNVEPPFAQLSRPLVLPKDDQGAVKICSDYANRTINAMTFKGRAEKRGWTRGSVCDGGSITSYVKTFPAADVDVYLNLDGMYIGIDMDSSITLQNFFFVRHGSVTAGSYVYDEPNKEDDQRLVPFAKVPAIAFSEAMSDLQGIAGTTGEGTDHA